jgi:hypothetical protein
MTRGQPLLALLSRAVVALWIGFYLAGPVLAPSPEAEAELTTARLQPRPVAPPEPAREPLPRPAAEPEAAPEPPEITPQPARPERLGAAEVAAGDRILSGGGTFPVLSCTYEDFPSFDAYARAMASLGARFVVVRQRRIVAAIDPATALFAEPEGATLDGSFSPRARDYTGEPALAPLTRAARERFGAGAVVMMLVPREIDAALFGGIARALASRGDHHEAYREIRGRYQRAPGGGLRLRVDRATRADGGEVAMDLLFDLAEVAGT